MSASLRLTLAPSVAATGVTAAWDSSSTEGALATSGPILDDVVVLGIGGVEHADGVAESHSETKAGVLSRGEVRNLAAEEELENTPMLWSWTKT